MTQRLRRHPMQADTMHQSRISKNNGSAQSITDRFAEILLEKRKAHSCILPVKQQAHAYADNLLAFLFPHFCEEVFYSAEEVKGQIELLKRDLKNLLLSLHVKLQSEPEGVAHEFMNRLPDVHDVLWQDAEAIYRGDPAAESIDEVIFAYPGFTAIAIYRFAHVLYNLGVPVLPRTLTEYAHQITGIDIHPGARIGNGFFIDHGTGVVIGETTEIGSNVKIYQGVNLGALSVDKTMAKTKRHPTIEDNVVIYAQAVILGGATTIGHHSVIGGNAWLTDSVPPYSIVYHTSEVKMREKKGDKDIEPIHFVI